MSTPVQRIMSAWSSDNRAVELTRAVETMASEGVTGDQLDQALGQLLDELRVQGVDDETEEIVNNVGDRLHGWCHPSRKIKTLPTGTELAKLPRWALVAFASRCAHRVLPLFSYRWRDAPKSYVEMLTWAVEVGERSAAYAGAVEDWAPPAGALTCAAYVCDAVNNAHLNRARAVEVIKGTVKAVATFKDKPEDIFDPHIDQLFRGILSHAVGAIANFFATSQETYNSAVPIVHGIIREDFDSVARLTASQHWTDDTPVSPTVFGPMWPSGTPNGWPDMPSPTDGLWPNITVKRLIERIALVKVA